MIAIANGVGASRAFAAVQAARDVAGGLAGACSIGTGGALDSSLTIGDVVVATAIETTAIEGEACPAAICSAGVPHGPPVRSGLVHSSPHIARTAEEKRKLNQSGAIIVEMEAAGVARAAQELAVPFYCVRVVSDLANETFSIDFERFIMSDGRFNIARLALRAIMHPITGLPELLRLQRRTAEAAQKLGDYLAQCDFPI